MLSDQLFLAHIWTYCLCTRWYFLISLMMVLMLAVPVDAQTIRFSTPTDNQLLEGDQTPIPICVQVTAGSFPLGSELAVTINDVTTTQLPNQVRATDSDYELSDNADMTEDDNVLTFQDNGEQCRFLTAVADRLLEEIEQFALGLEVAASPTATLGTPRVFEILDTTTVSWQHGVSALAVPEDRAFLYQLNPNVTLTEGQTVSIRLTLSSSGRAEPTDFNPNFVDFLIEQAQDSTIGTVERLSVRSVRVTLIGPLNAPGLFILQIRDDEQLEGIENIILRLDDPRIDGISGGTVDNAEIQLLIVQDTTSSLDVVPKLAIPLILRSALPSLSDAVRTHVTHVLQRTAPAPQASQQNFHIESARLLGVSHTTDSQIPIDWNVWTNGRHTAVNGNDRTSGSGNVFNLWTGIDYHITPQLLIGGLFGYERSDITINELDATMSGDGFAAGSYIGIRLIDEVMIDIAIAGMNLGYDMQARDLSRSTPTNPFDVSQVISGNRLMVSGNITGIWHWENWRFIPHLTIGWTREWHEKFQDNLGLPISAQVFSFGHLLIGPEIARHVQVSDDIWFEPSLGLERELTFGTDDPRTTIPSLRNNEFTYAVDQNDSTGFRTRFGLAGQWHKLYFRAHGSYAGISQSGFEAWSGDLSLSYGWNEQLLLNVTGNYTDTSSLVTNATYTLHPGLRLIVENRYDFAPQNVLPLSLITRIEYSF